MQHVMQCWPGKPRIFHENNSTDSMRSQLQGAPSPHSPKAINFCLTSASHVSKCSNVLGSISSRPYNKSGSLRECMADKPWMVTSLSFVS